VAYEIIGMAPDLSVQQQFAWLSNWKLWTPFYIHTKNMQSGSNLTEILTSRKEKSEYDLDGLVLKTNKPSAVRVVKGNPKDAIAWKPPNGEAKLTKVIQVEWNASSSGKLIPRVEIEPVQLGGSMIKHVTGVNARRIVDWSIGPGATVVIRKGGDVIPVIDRVEVQADVVFPSAGTWEWDGEPSTAVHIKQITADSTTITAQYMKMITRLGWDGIGPAQAKAVVEAGYTTVPLLRKVTEDSYKKLLGPVKGAHFYSRIQGGWDTATEADLFVASPLCPSGIGKTRLDALMLSEPNMALWGSSKMVAPKGWSIDALKEFQEIWKRYEAFRKTEWNFLPYPRLNSTPQVSQAAVQVKGTVVFTGFRDADLEAKLLEKGYTVSDTVKSNTKAILIADKEDPHTYTSTKIEKAKKLPGCIVLRKSDWTRI
jgi:NAD-dependent DNA ligase